MRVIAFYLPQYHPIPENDAWWGSGFTEWTNVSKTRPLYSGHYQPHIPADLGFYDLRLEETRIAQANLAREYGISAFCYYHYWFNGKMLLERPFNEVLASGKPDFPFCLCWANENWTRRWDGREREVLIEQDYGSYDPEKHIEWLDCAFRDQRYIKVYNKPLVLIYRASDIPNIKDIISIWRRAALKKGHSGLYICAAKNSQNSLTDQEIIESGFDAAYEFEPNLKFNNKWLYLNSMPGLNVISYKELVNDSIKREINSKLVTFPCVFPSWDNCARRKNEATIIQNEDEQLYKRWLTFAMNRIIKNNSEEQVVFINAWNEWAEGCHLEPDLKHGRKFLTATRQALNEFMGLDDHLFTETGNSSTEDATVLDNTGRMQDEGGYFVIDGGRPIYIWGTGSSGLRTLNLFNDVKVKVAGFIDSNPQKWGSCLDGIDIYSPDEILSKADIVAQCPFVIVASMFDHEIVLVLKQYNLKLIDDYVINIYNMRVAVRRKHGKINIIIHSGKKITCNICGYDQFINIHSEYVNDIKDFRCNRCGSMSKERMVIHALGDELGISGLPLLEWHPDKSMKILNIGSGNSYSQLLELYCSLYHAYDSLDELDGYKDDYFNHIIMSESKKGFSTDLNVCLKRIYDLLKEEGTVMINFKNSYTDLFPFTDNSSEIVRTIDGQVWRIGLIAKDYLHHNIDYEKVVLLRKISME